MKNSFTTLSKILLISGLALSLPLALTLTGCEKKDAAHGSDDGHDHGREGAGAGGAGKEGEAAPTNRVDIPASVRQNLGITFAKVESRNVAQTLRVPGRFELLPTARREYRTPLSGRVEILVSQYQKVEPGTPLYRVDASGWRDLHEQISATRARAESMVPLMAAQADHEKSLAEKVTLWQDRLKQLDELRSAGGGSATQAIEARATLNASQSELAVARGRSAELAAQRSQAESDLRSLTARHDVMTRGAGCLDGHNAAAPDSIYTVCAVEPGIVETIGLTPGALAEENGLVLTLVQPEKIRFHARGLQADLGRLRGGLPARIAPPQGGSVDLQDAMTGVLQLGLGAEADERTVDLLVTPESLTGWARAGVSAHMEVTLAGGTPELAVPQSAVVRDGARGIIFRRDPANPDKVIRMEADLGLSDGRWVVIASGVKEGDEIVLGGNFQLMLATSGSTEKAGHFHSDGTFHEGSH
ncbi:MAG: efflux RND transporter periplasmic adaptor subunit [Phycisphaerales bacterium]|nr:efflux RND transporter periplasmic adaptor subunit [Phycisphaerales bacterium]